jgi:hypothetical protein
MISLPRIFSSEVRVKLLSFLFSHPTENFHVEELSKRLKTPVTSIKKAVQAHEKAGILLTHKASNFRYYVLNRKCPIYEELKSIIIKTVGLCDVPPEEH